MDGLWLSDKIFRLIRDKKAQTTQFVMQGSTTERHDYNYMIGKFRVLEEIEDAWSKDCKIDDTELDIEGTDFEIRNFAIFRNKTCFSNTFPAER